MEYEILGIESLVALGLAKANRWSAPRSVKIPPIAYGDVTRPSTVHKEWPPETWSTEYYNHPGLICFELSDVWVHGELGIITCGRYCVAESLHMVFPKFHGFDQIDQSHITLPSHRANLTVGSAVHAICGYVGNRNYAHFWIDVVPIITEYLLGNRAKPDRILMSQVLASYQAQTLELFDEQDRFLFLRGADIASVSCLEFIPMLTAGDYHPNPDYIGSIEKLKRRVSKKSRDVALKIFISRKDAPARQMVNESALAEIASCHGFEIVETSKKSVREQIRLFSDTKYLVSAHGAGLANMLFCMPNAKILELQSAASINWSLRRLASITEATYGCVVGEPVRESIAGDGPESIPWFVDVQVFERALKEMLSDG